MKRTIGTEPAELDDVEPLDKVTVCFGEEKFAPVQYHSFGIGPFFMTTTVRAGETPEEAMLRAHRACEAVARKIYPGKRDAFLASCTDSSNAARARR
jgi:hypothetical protein